MKKETKQTIGLWVTGILVAVLGGYCVYDEIRIAQKEEENKRLKKADEENKTLRQENYELRGENKALERENRRLGRENGNLTYQIGKKEAERKGLYK